MRRGINLLDQGADAGTADIGQEFRRLAEPSGIRVPLADDHSRASPAQPPADHFIDGEIVRILRFYRHPAMDAEIAAPAPGARRVDLDHRFPYLGRIGGQADGFKAGRPPVARRGAVLLHLERRHADNHRQN